MDSTKYLKNYVEPKDKYNVIAVAVFETRKQAAAPEKRISMVRGLVDEVERTLPGFKVRIYYDNSVRVTGSAWSKAMRTLSKNPIVQLVLCDNPRFKDTGGYHSREFCSLLRFTSLFDQDNAGMVLVLDLVPQVIMRTKMLARQFEMSASTFHFKTKACMHTSAKHVEMAKSVKDGVFWQKAATSLVISKVRFDAAVFERLCRLVEASDSGGATGADDVFLNNVLLPHIDKTGVVFSYTLEDDVYRVIQDAKPQDTAWAGEAFKRILGQAAPTAGRGRRERTKNPQKALTNLLKMADAPQYPDAMQRLLTEFAALHESGDFVKMGIDRAQVECVLRHGRSRNSEFIVEKRAVMTFKEELQAKFPDAKTIQVPAPMLGAVAALMETRVCDGKMSLGELMLELSDGNNETIVFKGGIVRDLVRGITEFNDIDLAIHPVSVFEAARRLRRKHGTDLPMQSSRAISLVMIGSSPVDMIDVTDVDLNACTWDATCNALMLDPYSNTLIDPTGMGIEDAKNEMYRFSCTDLDLYVTKRSVPALWRALKFAIRGWSFVDEELIHLLKWIYYESAGTEEVMWTTLPFISNIPLEGAETAFAFLKERVDRYHADGKLDFDGGDMLMYLFKRGTITIPQHAAKGAQNSLRPKGAQNSPHVPPKQAEQK